MTDALLIFALFFPFAASLLSYVLGRRFAKARDIFAVAATFVELAAALVLFLSPDCTVLVSGSPVTVLLASSGIRKLYLLIASAAWFFSALFSPWYFGGHNHNRYYFFFLVTLGASAGVFLSESLMTAFIFFEILSFTSCIWVIEEETEGALRAAKTYLAVAVIGGLSAFMGLVFLDHAAGTLVISELAATSVADKSELYLAGFCLLIGFGAKAGMFPLHIWLPKAHPVAPAPASALLSGILTKIGVYGILAVTCNIFASDAVWGAVLLALGVITMLLGAVLGVLSVDLKRTLACSSMSQIGFILVGIAAFSLLEAEKSVAAFGVTLHMTSHSIFKLVLFLAAGIVYRNCHSLDLNSIRGFGKNKPLFLVTFLLGAMGISGVPLLSGYISKTYLHDALLILAGETGLPVVTAIEWVFLLSGGLTLAYMTKLFTVLFIDKGDSAEIKAYAPLYAKLAAFIPAILIPILGVQPIADKLATLAVPFFGELHELPSTSLFTAECLKGAAISITVGVAVYFLFVRTVTLRRGKYVNIIPERLDLEKLVYQPILLGFLPTVGHAVASVFGENKLLAPLYRYAKKLGAVIARLLSDSLDFLLLLSRRSFASEMRVKGEAHLKRSLKSGGHLNPEKLMAEEKRFAKRDAARTALGGFSFALIVACIGICAVLIVLLVMR